MSYLPCPFCGTAPEEDDLDFIHPITRPNPQTGRRVWGAHCSECWGGCGASVTGWSALECAAAWNRRPGVPVI